MTVFISSSNSTLTEIRDKAALPFVVARKAVASARFHWRASAFAKKVPLSTAMDTITMGSLDYGGYEIPDGCLDERSRVLSAGAGTDVTFESILVDRFGCRVHLVDPVPGSARYVAAALAHESRISFGNVALWTEDGELEFHEPAVEGFISHSATNMHATPVSFVAPARSISSLRTELGWPAIDMIKISAEGSEYAILESLLAGDERIPLVCVEFAQPAPLSRVLEAVAAMRGRGYEIVARSARPRNWKMSFVHPGYAAEADRRRQDDPGARTTTRV